MKKFFSMFLCVLLCTSCGYSKNLNDNAALAEPAFAASSSSTSSEISGAIEDPAPIDPDEPDDSTGLKPLQEDNPQLPLTGCRICIDPGHCVTPETGSGRREAISPLSDETKIAFGGGTSGKSLTEEQLNLFVGLKLRDQLEELGAEVVMTREVSEITITNRERSEIANESGADVCVRIHADGIDDSSVHGVSVLVPAGELLGTPSITEESRRLGELMVDAVSEETGAKNRGVVERSDLTGFNFSEIPTVLIEMGFMSNPDEDALLSTDAYRNRIVTGIINSLQRWYE